MIPERRIEAAALILGLATAILVALGWGAAAGVGITVGLALALWNYRWLRAGATALTQAASRGAVPHRPIAAGALKFILRFGLLGLCVFAILMSHLLPIAPVVGGLFVVPAAVLAEAVWQLRPGARAGN